MLIGEYNYDLLSRMMNYHVYYHEMDIWMEVDRDEAKWLAQHQMRAIKAQAHCKIILDIFFFYPSAWTTVLDLVTGNQITRTQHTRERVY